MQLGEWRQRSARPFRGRSVRRSGDGTPESEARKQKNR